MLLAAAAVPFFGGQLMPPFREGHFVVQSVAPPGTSLEAMKALGTGWAGGIGWRDVEVVNLEGGKPIIKLVINK